MCDKDLLKDKSVRRSPKRNNSGRNNGNYAFANDPEKRTNRQKYRVKVIIGFLIILGVISTLGGYFIGSSESRNRPKVEPPDPALSPTPAWSCERVFQKAAVCTDAYQCSEIGRKIISKNGSAVDAAIAAMFCNGLFNQQSMGIGGGFFMTVYIKDEGKAYSVNAREKAPAAAETNMFEGDSTKSREGPKSVGVPGHVRGMWAAHQRWGNLPWADLIAPTLDFCKNGYVMSKALYDSLFIAPLILNDLHLRKQYYNETRKAFHPPGFTVKPSEALCDTLQRIADKGGDDFYNGSLAVDIVNDLQKIGSIITLEDLKSYQVKIVEPITLHLQNGDTLYTPPLPSSGVLLAYILNILSGYNFTSESITTTDRAIQTYYRTLEAFKFAYAARTKLGDDDFLDLKDMIRNISSVEYATATRMKINETMTSNDTATYGAERYTKGDGGTAHMSIVAPNGNAVSVTSSINYNFGAGFSTLTTGIVMNNVMDDFSSPGITNFFGVEPSPANFIKPWKRPLSSMSPSIIVDSSGNAKLVVGASGGTKIVSAMALVTMRKLWFHQSIKEAIDATRIHHQIFPMAAEYQYGVTEEVLSGLRAKGHGMIQYQGRGSTICALYRNETAIYGNADYRKGGDVSGID